MRARQPDRQTRSDHSSGFLLSFTLGPRGRDADCSESVESKDGVGRRQRPSFCPALERTVACGGTAGAHEYPMAPLTTMAVANPFCGV
mmetsp:Transcript_15461/g.41508  ORF Transcript_15461/g.41508 Transcript_15461/m.41508 type:complete len:88 (+) Transcript_15461:70-333(+)